MADFYYHADIPLLLTVSSRITFQQFYFLEKVNEDDFKVPSDYERKYDIGIVVNTGVNSSGTSQSEVKVQGRCNCGRWTLE